MIPLNEISAIDLELCTAAITIIQRMKDALQPHLEDMLNLVPHVTFLPTKEFNIKTHQFPISNTFADSVSAEAVRAATKTVLLLYSLQIDPNIL